MRAPRIFGDASATPASSRFFHCVSRVVDRQILFQAEEKEVSRAILRKLEEFSGVRVATYCFMGNHFHLLVEVPERDLLPRLDAGRLFELLPLLHDENAAAKVVHEIESAREDGDTARERSILDRYERRRGDVSTFLKELKQRISIFMNRRLGRKGALWESRFRSVLLEGSESTLTTVAAYIDLNPIRAGLVSDPKDYRWSGYGEAMGSGGDATRARRGLGSIQREALEDPENAGAPDWKTVHDRYRRLLYEDEEKVTDAGTAGDPVGKPLVPLPVILRRKVRYFSDGAVLGSEAFVESAIEGLKADGRLGKDRKAGACRLSGGADWGELRVLRNLQIRVFGSAPD